MNCTWRAACSVCSWKVVKHLIKHKKNIFLIPITILSLLNRSKGIVWDMFFPCWPMNQDTSYVSRQCACIFLQNNAWAQTPPSADVLWHCRQCGTIHRIFTFLLPLVSRRSPSVNRHKDMWPALRHPRTIMAVTSTDRSLCTWSVCAWPGSCWRTSWLAPVGIINSVRTLVRFVFIYKTGTWFPPPWISLLLIWCLIASSTSWTWWRAACVRRGWGAFLLRPHPRRSFRSSAFELQIEGDLKTLCVQPCVHNSGVLSLTTGRTITEMPCLSTEKQRYLKTFRLFFVSNTK